MTEQTDEMYKAEQAQNEAWAKVTALWREAKANADAVMVTKLNKPTEETIHTWIVSTNGLYSKASEAYDNAVGASKMWVKAVNQAKINN